MIGILNKLLQGWLYLIRGSYQIITFIPMLIVISYDKYIKKCWKYTEVYDKIWQGRYYFFKTDLNDIKRDKFTLIIDCTNEFNSKKKIKFFNDNNIEYLNVWIMDWTVFWQEKLMIWLNRASSHIKNKDWKILVNCALWHWRSYQMTTFITHKIHWIEIDDCFDIIKEKRSCSWLQDYKKKMFKKNVLKTK